MLKNLFLDDIAEHYVEIRTQEDFLFRSYAGHHRFSHFCLEQNGTWRSGEIGAGQ
jgi:hypothetical protein